MKTLILTLAAILSLGFSHAAPQPAILNADTSSFQVNSWDLAAQETEVEMEAWMFDCNYWQNCGYQEEPIEMEAWMFETTKLEKDSEMVLEEWMFLPIVR